MQSICSYAQLMKTPKAPFGRAALDQYFRGLRHPGRPLLFLDFDDVICLNDPYGGYDVFAPDRPHDLWERLWAPRSVAVLREVVAAHNPEVVLTTSWLRLMDRDGFDALFAMTGLAFLGSALHQYWEAPQDRGGTRLQAVERWLHAHYEGQALVVLDDPLSGTGLRGSQLDRMSAVILCQVAQGLLPSHVPLIAAAFTEASVLPRVARR